MLNMEEKTDQILKDMFSSGMHLGYSATSRHPQMGPFLFGVRNGVEIFDLEKTKGLLDKAKEFLKKLGKEKKQVVFVGTKKEAREFSEKAAKELDMPYVKERWLGGTLTNFKEIKSRIDYLIDLKKKRTSGELDKYTKKEKLQIERKIEKLERYLGGLETLVNYPAALIVIDSKHENISVAEANQVRTPVIALLNSDCDPKGIDYPVPANDSSLTSINYFLTELTKAYKEGVLSAPSPVAAV